MATLAPVLGGNAASFERPVQQGASGVEALASVLGTVGGAISTAIANNQPAAPREPTADERFGEAWTGFVEQVGTALDPSNPNYLQNLRTYSPQFLRAFPEFAGQTGQLLRTQGVENTLTPQQTLQQTQEDAMVTFYSTPEGMIEQGLARQAATSADGVFNEQAYSDELDQRYGGYLIRQADYSRLAEEAAAGADIAAVSNRFWTVAAPEAENLVQGAMSDMFNIIEQMRLNPGGRLELDPSMATAMGLPTNTISAENLPLVLQTFRNTLRLELRNSLQGQASFEVNPPTEEWYNSVLAPFDALTQAAGDFDSLPSISSAIQSAGIINATRQLQQTNPGLAARIDFFNVINPGLMTNLQQYTSGIGEDIVNYTATLMGVTMSQEEAADAMNDLPVSDVEGVLETTAALLANGDQLNPEQVRNAFTTMVEAERRVNGDGSYFSADAWEQIVGANVQQYLQAAQMDPSFANILADGLMGDINKTLTQIQNMNSGTVLTPVMETDGTLSLVVDEAQIVAQLAARGYTMETTPAQFVQERENLIDLALAQASNATLDLYNMKVQTLGSLGAVGAQITDAITIQNSPMLGAAGDAEPAGGPEGDTLSSSSAPTTSGLLQLIDRTEGGADYDTLFSFSNRDGGAFAGTNVSQMTIGELVNFAKGPYGEWSRGQLGYTATPMGRYQFVGTTLEATARDMGLPDDTVFTPEVQDAMFVHKVNERLRTASTLEGKMSALRSEWHGFRSVSDEELAAAITQFENGGTLDFTLTDGAGGGGTMMITPGLLAPTEAVRPYRRPTQATQESQGIRPRARPTESASGAPMRPQSRPTGGSSSQGGSRTSASQQAAKASRDKAIEVLLRNGFSRSDLSVMGIS